MHRDPARAVYRAARRAARNSDRPFLLAVSGGLDSMALLGAMSQVARGRIAAVATFDHRTGDAATRAVALVEAEAQRLGVPVIVGRMPESYAAADGREAAWRKARHAFLRGAAAEREARVATAHTEDDQLETVLMRIMRGSGARGLAALYAEGPVARPFLGVRRATLEAFAAAAGIAFVEDPGNASREFTRNRVRHDLLPALRRVRSSIDMELLSLASRAALLRRDVEAFVDEVVVPDVNTGRVLTAAKALDGYDGESLALLWGALAGRAGLALDRRGTSRAVAFTKSGARSGSVQIAGGWVLEATSSAYIMERPAVSAFPAVAKLPQAGSLEWGPFRFRVSVEGEAASPWAASISGDGAMVRAWEAGDRLGPAGGQRKRRVTRYLSDVGLKGRERAGWPVVLSGEDVVWIPGVRRSDAATDRSGRPARHYVCERTDR